MFPFLACDLSSDEKMQRNVTFHKDSMEEMHSHLHSSFCSAYMHDYQKLSSRWDNMSLLHNSCSVLKCLKSKYIFTPLNTKYSEKETMDCCVLPDKRHVKGLAYRHTHTFVISHQTRRWHFKKNPNPRWWHLRLTHGPQKRPPSANIAHPSCAVIPCTC